jgi:hypothetical protein
VSGKDFDYFYLGDNGRWIGREITREVEAYNRWLVERELDNHAVVAEHHIIDWPLMNEPEQDEPKERETE